MNKIYAGIGSRSTPVDVISNMKLIASTLAINGYTLRSGHADGADMAFEIGCDSVNGKKEIFIPWRGFNGSDSKLYNVSNNMKAIEIAEKFHPNWKACSEPAKNYIPATLPRY